jgi:hypothetical protein
VRRGGLLALAALALAGPSVASSALAQTDPELVPALDALTGPFAELTEALDCDQCRQLGPIAEDKGVWLEIEAPSTTRCFSFAAVAEEAVTDLDLRVFFGDYEVAADTSRDALPRVHWCRPDSGGAGTVEVLLQAVRGSGAFAFEARGADLEPRPAMEGQLAARLSAMTARYALGFLPAQTLGTSLTSEGPCQPAMAGPAEAAATTSSQDVLGTGQSASYRCRLPADHCFVFIGVATATAMDLDLTLRRDQGERGGDDVVDFDWVTDETPVLRYCVPSGEATRSLRLEVAMHAGYGGYRVGVFGD